MGVGVGVGEGAGVGVGVGADKGDGVADAVGVGDGKAAGGGGVGLIAVRSVVLAPPVCGNVCAICPGIADGVALLRATSNAVIALDKSA